MPRTRVRGGAGGQAHWHHTLARMWTSVKQMPTYGWVGAPPNVDPQSRAGLPLATVAVHLGLVPNPVAHPSLAARPATAAAGPPAIRGGPLARASGRTCLCDDEKARRVRAVAGVHSPLCKLACCEATRELAGLPSRGWATACLRRCPACLRFRCGRRDPTTYPTTSSAEKADAPFVATALGKGRCEEEAWLLGCLFCSWRPCSSCERVVAALCSLRDAASWFPPRADAVAVLF